MDPLPFTVLNERLRPPLPRLYAAPSIWETTFRAGSSAYRRDPDPEESDAPSEEAAGEDSETGSLDSDGWTSMDQDQGDRTGLLSLLNQCLSTPAARTTDADPPEGDEPTPTSSPDAEGTEGSSAGEETGRDVDPRVRDGGGCRLQRSYTDRSLPDLIRGSGRPLSRRRTLGPVSETLKEVRREVELSRRRSIRLKAQVDKLQETSDGPGWSRERVTEEVLSVLRLLSPLTEPQTGLAEASPGAERLDGVLSRLHSVARTLAISHGEQTSGGVGGRRSEDKAILEQALRDRDEAVERKKAMEAELLRSKTDLMALNNQLLEAVQKRLELSLELEAWKEDLQYILQQQLQSQQAEQQAPKKTRGGLLRRTDRVPVQRPPTPAHTPITTTTHIHTPTTTHITSNKQIFITSQTPSLPPQPSKAVPSQGFGSISRAWKGRFKRGKILQGDQEQASGKDVTGFQTVSLD